MPFNHVLYEPSGNISKPTTRPKAKRSTNSGSLQKGHSINALPEGTTRKKGRNIEIKKDGRWIMLARHIYELYHGPISTGLVVWHIDGNPSNNEIDNLELIPRAEISKRTKKKRQATLRKIAYRDKLRKTMDLKTIIKYVKPRIGEVRSISVSGSIDRKHNRILQEMAKERNTSRSEIIRDAITDYLKKHQKITT